MYLFEYRGGVLMKSYQGPVYGKGFLALRPEGFEMLLFFHSIIDLYPCHSDT